MDSSQVFSEVANPGNFQFVKEVINKMEPDVAIGPVLMDLLDKEMIETRAAIAWAAKKIKPKQYLEIGTRRGWSLGMVVAAAPECECYCFDIWEAGYSGSPNPGPEFVTNEMSKLGYNKTINFVSGDSHQTVPKFFNDNPKMTFDLILVDGDHTVDGALDDLKNTMPYVNKGGILIFDDIVMCARLDEVFYHLKNIFPDFEYHAYTEHNPGVGIAIRNK